MSVNRYMPHILVLPEDDANRQLANGFLLGDRMSTRQIQVLEAAGGWIEVLDRFKSDQVGGMNKYPGRFMVLLIDFDGKEDRLDKARAAIPDNLLDRVLVLGAWTEPEAVRTALGSTYEHIGRRIAEDCRDGTDLIWGDSLLRHNTTEIARLQERVRPILFPTR